MQNLWRMTSLFSVFPYVFLSFYTDALYAEKWAKSRENPFSHKNRDISISLKRIEVFLIFQFFGLIHQFLVKNQEKWQKMPKIRKFDPRPHGDPPFFGYFDFSRKVFLFSLPTSPQPVSETNFEPRY